MRISKMKKNPPTNEQQRTLGFIPEQRDAQEPEDSRHVRLSFSSDTPVDMGWGMEALSHQPGAMRTGERQTSMPLLYNHNRDDVIGVVESIGIEGNKGYADVRFAKNARGQEIFDLVQDGILRNVSFMYRVFKYEEDVERDLVLATDWEPYEISVVTVPADPNVGVGRSLSTEKGADQSAVDCKAVVSNEREKMEDKDFEKARIDAVQQERSRINEIAAMCRAHGIDENKRNAMIDGGISIDAARAAVLEDIKARGIKPVGAEKTVIEQKDMAGYSVIKAVRATVTGDWSKAGLEREVSKELGRSLGRDTEGFFMPTSLRDYASKYTVGTPADGGNLVATNLLAGNFIDLLRNKSSVMQLGATILSGLVGNVAIPRQSGASSTYWVAEDGIPTASKGSFDQLTLSPKTIGAITSISRNLMLQSTPAIEMLVRNDLAQVLALGIDLAALAGTGTGNQPTGIINTTGVGAVTLTGEYDDIIDLETAVATANADVEGMAYVANAAMVGALKKMKDGDERPIWYQQPGAASGTPGQINGYQVCRTNQCPANNIIFGNFRDVVIGEWGALEILPNAYGEGYKAGAIELRALQTVDIGLRHAASFAVAKPAASGNGQS